MTNRFSWVWSTWSPVLRLRTTPIARLSLFVSSLQPSESIRPLLRSGITILTHWLWQWHWLIYTYVVDIRFNLRLSLTCIHWHCFPSLHVFRFAVFFSSFVMLIWCCFSSIDRSGIMMTRTTVSWTTFKLYKILNILVKFQEQTEDAEIFKILVHHNTDCKTPTTPCL